MRRWTPDPLAVLASPQPYLSPRSLVQRRTVTLIRNRTLERKLSAALSNIEVSAVTKEPPSVVFGADHPLVLHAAKTMGSTDRPTLAPPQRSFLLSKAVPFYVCG